MSRSIFALLSFCFLIGATDAWARSGSFSACGADLSESLITAALRGEDVRHEVLQRRASFGDVDFKVPEFRPMLEQMLGEVNTLEKEALNRNTLWPNQLLRQNFTLPVQAMLLRKKIQSLLDNGIRYWETIEVAEQFADFADSALRVKGEISFLDRRTFQGYIKENKKFAKVYPVLFVPTFRELSIQEINRLWQQGIFPLGLATQTVRADGRIFTPRKFLIHDMQHAISAIYKFATLLRYRENEKEPWDINEVEAAWVNQLISRQRLKAQQFFLRVDALRDTRLKEGVEYSYFYFDHETGGMSVTLERPLQDGDFKRYSNGFSRIGRDHDNVAPEEFPRRLENLDPAFWQKATHWILKNWPEE
jgi:hypothetical protein